MPSAFAARLADAIRAAGITQAELARHAGVSGASVSDWVRGVTDPTHIKAVPLLKAAACLRVSAEWLLFGAGTPPPHAPQRAREPEAIYAVPWPFDAIDRQRLAALPRADLLRLEGAWLLVARQLGVDVIRRG